LKRHEDLWIQALSLLGWKMIERYEVPLDKFKRIYEKLKEIVDLIDDLKKEYTFPSWLSEELKPVIGLGMLTLDKIMNFIENINRRFEEYMLAPKAMVDPKEAKTGFLTRLRRSVVTALAIRGTDKEKLREVIRSNLYIILSRGVMPIDYSYNYIIIAKKSYRYRGSERIWLSYLGYDPIEVLRGLEERPAIVMLEPEKIELIFEKRDIGWGLSVVEKP